ncbi:MAG: DUF481 domain-containing protein [Candidatus Aminicenantes bacterium]|jgi:hypothetical protein
MKFFRGKTALWRWKKISGSTIATLIICIFPSISFAQKTDVVILNNGDRITGEIKKLERGKLEYKTDDVGTIYIDWAKIDYISSKNKFDIEMETGVRYIGSIEMGEEEAKLVVVTSDLRFNLDLISIVKIYPLEATFWKRVKGYLDLGLSFQRAQRKVEWKLGGEVSYRGEKWMTRLDASSYYIQQEEVARTSRNNLSFLGQRILKSRWLGTFVTSHEQNDELNLDYRALLGGAIGRFFIQDNRYLLVAYAGLSGSREKYRDSEDITYNAEGLLNVQYEAFRYDSPTLDFGTSLSLFPSLTTRGRVRINFSARLSYEIFNDFYIALDGFYNYDTKPPGDEARKYDYSINTSISWRFK